MCAPPKTRVPPPIRVDLAPGSKFRYSGGGTTIAQLALVERSKQPYPQVLAERVLGPLGMVHSTFDQAEQALATLDADLRIPADGKPPRRRHAEAQLAKLRGP